MSKLLSASPTAMARRGASSRTWSSLCRPGLMTILRNGYSSSTGSANSSRSRSTKPGHARGAAGDVNPLNVFAAGGGPEEIESLLNFQNQDVGNRAQNGAAMLLGNSGNGFALLEPLGVLIAQVEFFLQRVGILISAHRNVAREQRDAAPHDIDIHDAGADVQQRHGLAGIGVVVQLVAVLQREGVDIHDRRRLAGLRQHVGVIQNLVLLHRHQQHVHLRIQRFQQLVVEIHVGNIEGNMLAGFGLDAVVKLFFGHHGQRYPLHDHRVARNRRGHRSAS